MASNNASDQPERKLYGRRKTRALGRERLGAMDALLPKLQITLQEKGKRLDPLKLFPFAPTQLWLEIGFGNGEHVASLMRHHPDRAFLAAEPFITGMAAFLKQIENKPHQNVRVWMDDAMLLADGLVDACLDGLYILNPDPWPKRRHIPRRIASHDNLTIFARLLKPDGALILATDHDGLADWIVTQGSTHPDFEWTAESAEDWRLMPANWVETRYQAKGAAAGRRQTYLIFRRR